MFFKSNVEKHPKVENQTFSNAFLCSLQIGAFVKPSTVVSLFQWSGWLNCRDMLLSALSARDLNSSMDMKNTMIMQIAMFRDSSIFLAIQKWICLCLV